MSRLARLSLAYRSLVALVSIAILGFGLVATGALKQELIPSLEIPGAYISTVYPGASPEIVEREVTKPIESAVAGVDGLDKTTSTSSDGFSLVQADFTYGTDIGRAVQNIQQSINRLSGQLPDDVQPTVQAGSFNDLPVVLLAVSSDQSQQDLARALDDRVVPELDKLTDVRQVMVTGERDRQVSVTVDDKKLADRGVSLQGVIGALQANGVNVPGGQFDSGDRSLSVSVGSPFTSVADLRNLPVLPGAGTAGAGTGSGTGGSAGAGGAGQSSAGQAGGGSTSGSASGSPSGSASGSGTGSRTGSAGSPGGAGQAAPAAPTPVRLSDVATVEETLAPTSSITRTNGRPTLGIAVTKTAEGNTVAVSHAVQDRLDELRTSIGGDAKLTVVFDQAPFIEESIHGLTTEGAIGLLFAVLVILVFLLSLRSTLVTAVSIPFSLLVAMLGLYAGGYSLNILTLGALTVAIGRVVDDSIVVLENIKRHLGYGEDKLRAILDAVREVAGAVTASTVTTVGVFAPIAFVGGQVGELFRPFAVTVSIALAASLLVSLTIIPVLAYWFLRRPSVDPADEARVRAEAVAKERRNPLQRAYIPVISWTTRHKVITLLVGVLVFAGTIGAAPLLKTNFLDDSGQNTVTVNQAMPVSSSLAATDTAAKKVEKVIAGLDGVKSYQTTVGTAEFGSFSTGGRTNQATFSLTTKDDIDQTVFRDRLRKDLDRLTGVGTLTVEGAQSGPPGSSNLEVEVSAPTTEALRTAAEQVEKAVRGVDGASDVTNNLSSERPTVQVEVDRAKAAAAGLSEAQIGQAVRQAFEGQQAGTVTLDSEQSDVMVYAGSTPRDLASMRRLPLPTPLGTTVRLDSVAKVSEVAKAAQLTRTDGRRTATISATPNTSNVGKVSSDLDAALSKLKLTGGATYKLGGVSSEQSDAFGQLGVAMLAAIAIVFLVMVATFRSIVQPLILLVSVPFAATGALALLLATDTALGVPALIGMLMLVGIVVTNAIVLIDLINQYRDRGMSVREAVIEGGRRRLRPILMTALATICALVPMSLGLTGGGVFISQPLAIVVIGGLVSSTLLTLVLVPTLYTLVEEFKERRRRRRGSDTREGDVARQDGTPRRNGAHAGQARAGEYADAGGHVRSTHAAAHHHAAHSHVAGPDEHVGEHGEDTDAHLNGVPAPSRTGNGSSAPAATVGGAAGAVAGSAVTTVNANRPPSADGVGPGEPVRVQVEVVVRTVPSEPDTRPPAADD
ncbi:efflux RND transporter permease subunit [Actinopolymorpha singaporensis]|uniref:Hydrophobic/amphiphilic exporter-1, HAE1 family n=1 Tax=Actinopolymorpha singaporensis TaxID=117157 RepID=A0A1H1SH02_9ACTN|nr:efflux RND transporter permease subunit [Actinopolymorpha singaporensis]SDS47222.1 hydrophobic/amphiphilic exporter-1, HAE1 family [Actinopolymorpha singaporensis]